MTAVTFGVNASVLAELNGKVDLDIDKGSDRLNASLGGSAKAFAGAKGGVEIGADLRWSRYSVQTYGNFQGKNKNLTSLDGLFSISILLVW